MWDFNDKGTSDDEVTYQFAECKFQAILIQEILFVEESIITIFTEDKPFHWESRFKCGRLSRHCLSKGHELREEREDKIKS